MKLLRASPIGLQSLEINVFPICYGYYLDPKEP